MGFGCVEVRDTAFDTARLELGCIGSQSQYCALHKCAFYGALEAIGARPRAAGRLDMRDLEGCNAVEV